MCRQGGVKYFFYGKSHKKNWQIMSQLPKFHGRRVAGMAIFSRVRQNVQFLRPGADMFPIFRERCLLSWGEVIK
jgi:hypothetical protein